jgi:hypothetical protein
MISVCCFQARDHRGLDGDLAHQDGRPAAVRPAAKRRTAVSDLVVPRGSRPVQSAGKKIAVRRCGPRPGREATASWGLIRQKRSARSSQWASAHSRVRKRRLIRSYEKNGKVRLAMMEGACGGPSSSNWRIAYGGSASIDTPGLCRRRASQTKGAACQSGLARNGDA